MASRRTVLRGTDRQTAVAVYYVACVNRIFAGPDGVDGPFLPEAIVEVSRRARRPVWIPPDLSGSCCATIWHFKGYDDGNTVMANRFVERAWEWTDGGRLPRVVDVPSCTQRKHRALTVVDSIVWAATELLPHLKVADRIDSVVIHPTCSMRHLGDTEQLRAVAQDVRLPVCAECCGFADDRGLELTCAVSGEEMQRGRTRQLIFSVLALIAKLSGVPPLLPGDVIFTGTPAGVGLGRTPQPAGRGQ
ncbi:fumarylacetoacetate hydrolase family protein [Streptomyces sp. Ncost-T10-10d]|uniref:fumarylacetoacetate hydrolase family protein n=1 Tax=Streptomyces sp. Ncost-T10-10d TaxID=1839774 RepID=UPI00081DFB2A|nr:D-lactate dehydrogenase [Streptomyces sp. Ncost-T10-10d]